MSSTMMHFSPHWWLRDNNIDEGIFSHVRAIDEHQAYRAAEDLTHARLYGNAYTRDLSLRGYARQVSRANMHRVTMNICASMCDTVAAKLCKNRPKATFLTSGGDFTQQRKARRLDRFVFGQFYHTDIYAVMPKVVMDALIFGTGFLKVFHCSQKGIACERVLPSEILCDDSESMYARPQTLYQRKYISLETLKGLYPHLAEQLDRVEHAEALEDRRNLPPQLEVIEAWHLPTVKGGEGRHVIAVDGLVLLDELYAKTHFPFVTLRYQEKLLGYYGSGLIEQLTGIQIELNRLLRAIQEQQHLAKPKILVEMGSQVSKMQLSNEVWGVINYTGTPPTFYVPRTVSPDVVQHIDRLYNRAYEIAGVSMLDATSRKPAGLESGVALREFNDITTERFMLLAQRYEQAYLDAGKLMIDLARDLHADGEDTEVISYGDKEIEKIKWSEIDLAEDMYVMKVYPTNLLPATPAAKLQRTIEMLQGGLLDKRQALVLLDYPDLESVNNLATAAYKDIQLLIEEMLERGNYHVPEPMMNIPMALEMVNSAYLLAKTQGAPEERLDLLRRFLEESAALLQTKLQSPFAPPEIQNQMAQGPQAPSGATPAGMPPELMAEEPVTPVEQPALPPMM